MLRVWERRYSAVAPSRTAGGQRLYSDVELDRLVLLARASAHGRSIGQIATLGADALRALIAEDDAARTGAAAPASLQPNDTHVMEAALAHIEAFDAVRLEQLLRAESLRRGADDAMDHVIVPLLTAIGDRWHAGTLNPAHEHLASAAVRRVLGSMFAQAVAPDSAPAMVVATPAGQLHELGAMLAAIAAASRGWRVVYLGANLPAHDIAAASVRARAHVIALSAVHPALDAAAVAELRALRRDAPLGARVVLGGAAAVASRDRIAGEGVDLVHSMDEWRAWLGEAGNRVAFAS